MLTFAYILPLATIKMKKTSFIILTLAILFSCNDRTNKAVAKDITESEKGVFDSTYYKQLETAFIKKDTTILNELFDNWHSLSKVKNNNTDQITSTIENIFNEVYHPFDLEKYGWLARPHYSKYQYAILSSLIRFKIIENFALLKQDGEFDMYSMDLDTISPFYPNPDVGTAKILYDIEPYKTSMQLFLSQKSYQKSFFLDSTNFINTPMSNDWKEYQTTPEILGILINNQMDSALVDLRLISTGVRINLYKKLDKWEMQEVKELWIE